LPTFLIAAALRRYLLAIGMNLLPLSSMRAWLLSLCGVKVGKSCYIGFGVMVDTNHPHLIIIGSGVTISHNCTLVTHTQTPIKDVPLSEAINHIRPIKIMDGSWIGLNSVILPGAIIAENTFIGAGSVVPAITTRPGCLYAGNPCKLRRSILDSRITKNNF